jgi:hypothetical protein
MASRGRRVFSVHAHVASSREARPRRGMTASPTSATQHGVPAHRPSPSPGLPARSRPACPPAWPWRSHRRAGRRHWDCPCPGHRRSRTPQRGRRREPCSRTRSAAAGCPGELGARVDQRAAAIGDRAPAGEAQVFLGERLLGRVELALQLGGQSPGRWAARALRPEGHVRASHTICLARAISAVRRSIAGSTARCAESLRARTPTERRRSRRRALAAAPVDFMRRRARNARSRWGCGCRPQAAWCRPAAGRERRSRRRWRARRVRLEAPPRLTVSTEACALHSTAVESTNSRSLKKRGLWRAQCAISASIWPESRSRRL